MNLLFYYSKPIDPIQGGIARITAFLGDYLKKNGHQVYYLSPEKENTTNDAIEMQLSLDNKDITNDKKVLFKKFITELKIDILIHQSATTPSQNYIVKWAKENNIKVLSVFHSSLFGIYGVKGRKYTNILPKCLIPFLNKSFHIYFKNKYSSAYKELISLSDKIVLLSDKFVNELEYFANYKKSNKIIAIPNPLTILPKQKNNQKDNVILSVGRLSASKQINLLLKIWNNVYNKYPDWSLEIIGDGEERKNLEKISSNMGLKNIIFRGFQTPDKYYEQSKIFCMTSAHEGFGLVLVEGMANGVVPIAFNSYPNIIDIIDDNINGMLVNPFSIEEYTEKLERLIINKKALSNMSENAILKSKSFSIDHIGKMWLDLIHNL